MPIRVTAIEKGLKHGIIMVCNLLVIGCMELQSTFNRLVTVRKRRQSRTNYIDLDLTL